MTSWAARLWGPYPYITPHHATLSTRGSRQQPDHKTDEANHSKHQGGPVPRLCPSPRTFHGPSAIRTQRGDDGSAPGNEDDVADDARPADNQLSSWQTSHRADDAEDDPRAEQTGSRRGVAETFRNQAKETGDESDRKRDRDER